MPTPIGSRPTNPARTSPAEETTKPPAAAVANTSVETTIPAPLQALLRSRSPVRTAEHAARRWAELPRIQSKQETLEHQAVLETSQELPDEHELHIDSESYRLLSNSLSDQAQKLPREAPARHPYGNLAFAWGYHDIPGVPKPYAWNMHKAASQSAAAKAAAGGRPRTDDATQKIPIEAPQGAATNVAAGGGLRADFLMLGMGELRVREGKTAREAAALSGITDELDVALLQSFKDKLHAEGG